MDVWRNMGPSLRLNCHVVLALLNGSFMTVPYQGRILQEIDPSLWSAPGFVQKVLGRYPSYYPFAPASVREDPTWARWYVWNSHSELLLVPGRFLETCPVPTGVLQIPEVASRAVLLRQGWFRDIPSTVRSHQMCLEMFFRHKSSPAKMSRHLRLQELEQSTLVRCAQHSPFTILTVAKLQDALTPSLFLDTMSSLWSGPALWSPEPMQGSMSDFTRSFFYKCHSLKRCPTSFLSAFWLLQPLPERKWQYWMLLISSARCRYVVNTALALAPRVVLRMLFASRFAAKTSCQKQRKIRQVLRPSTRTMRPRWSRFVS
jgi:hypothetical protein